MSLLGPFKSADDTYAGTGLRPFVFDILQPNRIDSALPLGLRLVMHVNPSSMNISYSKTVQKIQTRGGWVEQHWGEVPAKISASAVTGGFKRLYSGLSNITGTTAGGSRRETVAYDRYLDLLALFRNNGIVYNTSGHPVFSGAVKLTFDEGVYVGWFETFSPKEDASQPFMFSFDFDFTVEHEVTQIRSLPYIAPQQGTTSFDSVSIAHISKVTK